MADISNLSAGQMVSFSLTTNLISSVYNNVTILGIVGYDMAMLTEDVNAIHRNIYSSLPDNTPSSAKDYNYLIVRLQDGTKKAVGAPWISNDIKVVSSVVYTVTIRDGSADSTDLIRKALQSRGFTDITITSS